MDGDRTTAVLADPDQWARCAHENTALRPEGGVELSWAELSWVDEPPCPGPPPRPAGLAFDRRCRAYRTRPDTGRVEVAGPDGVAVPACGLGPLRGPLGVAVDRRQRLYVAEVGAGTVQVVDLDAGRPLRRVPVPAPPVDAAAYCGRAVVLAGDALWLLDGRRGARPGPRLVPPRCHGPLRARRVAPGPLVLWGPPTGTGGLVADLGGAVVAEVDGATDLDVTLDGTVVVAGPPGRPFRRFRRLDGSWAELEPVGAPGYDGGAVAVAPNGRIAFTTAAGVASTSGSAARRLRRGRVVTYRLDGGEYRTRWGRLFVDACLPPGTSLGVRFVTGDEDAVADPLDRTAPARGARPVRRPAGSPPLPSARQLAAAGDPRPVYRRPADPGGARTAAMRTYEAPVHAEPGRYLWVELSLRGTTRVTPRVRALRVERPGHALLRVLPRSWSRGEQDAAFLHRFLAPAEGVLHDLDVRAARREQLVDPAAVPADLLPWLAGLVGLALDARWPERARRELVGQAVALFRLRGTAECLLRILALYLGFRPGLVEEWRLRGVGGTVLDTSPRGEPSPQVGGGARAAGALGRFTVGGTTPDRDAFARSAHRFCVLVPGELTAEQRAVVTDVLDAHRPAHTHVLIAELGPGMRVGRRLRVALTSYVGPAGTTPPVVVGQGSVGADAVVGRPAVGARLGSTSVAGQVRVG